MNIKPALTTKNLNQNINQNVKQHHQPGLSWTKQIRQLIQYSATFNQNQQLIQYLANIQPNSATFNRIDFNLIKMKQQGGELKQNNKKKQQQGTRRTKADAYSRRSQPASRIQKQLIEPRWTDQTKSRGGGNRLQFNQINPIFFFLQFTTGIREYHLKEPIQT